jgi:hypothetical protein
MLFGPNENFSTSPLLILTFIAANLPFPVERVFFAARPGNGGKRWRRT